MYVNHLYKVLFLRHAKTASSSLFCHFGGCKSTAANETEQEAAARKALSFELFQVRQGDANLVHEHVCYKVLPKNAVVGDKRCCPGLLDLYGILKPAPSMAWSAPACPPCPLFHAASPSALLPISCQQAKSVSELEKLWQDYFVVTFVRNPYQRAVSSYRMMMRQLRLGGPAAEGYSWNRFCADPTGFADECMADEQCKK